MLKSKFNKLNDRSKQILSVFTKTVSDLTILNDDIALEVTARGDKAKWLRNLADLEGEKATALLATSDYNTNVIAKITSFLED